MKKNDFHTNLITKTFLLPYLNETLVQGLIIARIIYSTKWDMKTFQKSQRISKII